MKTIRLVGIGAAGGAAIGAIAGAGALYDPHQKNHGHN